MFRYSAVVAALMVVISLALGQAARADSTPPLFYDGFGNGFAAWNYFTPSNSTLTPVSVQAQTGPDGTTTNYVARLSNDGSYPTGARAWKVLSSPSAPQYTLYLSSRVYITSVTGTSNKPAATLFRLRLPLDGMILSLNIDGNGQLGYHNHIAGYAKDIWTGVNVAPGDWHNVQVNASVAGSASQVQIWVDGSPVWAQPKTDNLGNTPIGKVQIGDETFGRKFDVSYDDVTASTSFIGQASLPVPPANTVLPAISGTAANGQTLTADPGIWSGTQPITFSYQWQRCDINANCSDIAGANTNNYTLGAADETNFVRLNVTAGNSAGQATASSILDGPVQHPSDNPPICSDVVTGSSGATVQLCLSSTPAILDNSIPLAIVANSLYRQR
jgi:hypothetical protein